jgi:hypothetical protein
VPEESMPQTIISLKHGFALFHRSGFVGVFETLGDALTIADAL